MHDIQIPGMVYEIRRIELSIRRVAAACADQDGAVCKTLSMLADELWVIAATGKDHDRALQALRESSTDLAWQRASG